MALSPVLGCLFRGVVSGTISPPPVSRSTKARIDRRGWKSASGPPRQRLVGRSPPRRLSPGTMATSILGEAHGLTGTALEPGQPGYEEEVAGFNAAVVHRPEVVVGARTVEEI